MPYARLLVPVIPCGVLVCAMTGGPRRLAVLAAMALAIQGVLGWRHLPEATRTAASRRGVMAQLAPALAGAERVAGLDVGLLAGSHAGAIVDLAGLTMPEVAKLRGGHTSKHLPEGFLDAQRVDAFVLWAPASAVVELGPRAVFGRVVETRLARSPATIASFTEYASIPWDDAGASLVVFRRASTR